MRYRIKWRKLFQAASLMAEIVWMWPSIAEQFKAIVEAHPGLQGFYNLVQRAHEALKGSVRRK